MIEDKKPDRGNLIYLGVVALFALATYVNYLMLPVVGNAPEFKIEWEATRGFLMTGASPYAISRTLYSSSVDLFGANIIISAYHQPFFRSIIQFPLSFISSFELAAAIRMTIIEVAFGALIFLIWKILPWRQTRAQWSLLVLLIVMMPFSWLSVIAAGETVIVLVLLTLSVLSVSKGMPEVGGVLLALGFTMFEVFGLAIFSILVWLIYRREFNALIGFGLTFLLLVFLAHIFFPEWYMVYFTSQYLFSMIKPLATSGSYFVNVLPGAGATLSKVFSVIILALLLYEWHTLWKRDENAFVWVFALMLIASPVLGFGTLPQWQVTSVLATALVVSRFANRWGNKGFWLSFFVMAMVEIYIFLTFRGNDPTAMLIWVPVIQIIMLYWVRWDSVRTTKLWADILEEVQHH